MNILTIRDTLRKYQDGVSMEKLLNTVIPETQRAQDAAAQSLLDGQKFGVHIFAAATPLQVATQKSSEGMGLFVKILLEGLGRGQAMTAQQLGEFLTARLPEFTSGRQTPVIRSVGADFYVGPGGEKQ
jgi:hypothetical protein